MILTARIILHLIIFIIVTGVYIRLWTHTESGQITLHVNTSLVSKSYHKSCHMPVTWCKKPTAWFSSILYNTRIFCQLVINEILTECYKMAGICRYVLWILVIFPVLCLYPQASLASPGFLFLNDTYDLVAKHFGISKFPLVTQLSRNVSTQCMDKLINLAFNPKEIFLCEYNLSRLFMVNLAIYFGSVFSLYYGKLG